MAAKPRKSVVQNIIKNLLEMEIPEIQTASKELAEWIKQLEQHSFKLQHYATEIESWASEEEEVDSVELTDLIKDLEATLSDMRGARANIPSVEDLSQPPGVVRGYGRSGRVLKDAKAMPKSEIKVDQVPVKQIGTPGPAASEVEVEELARTEEGVLLAKEKEKPVINFPVDTRKVSRESAKTPPEEEAKEYMTPEGFLIRRLRP